MPRGCSGTSGVEAALAECTRETVTCGWVRRPPHVPGDDHLSIHSIDQGRQLRAGEGGVRRAVGGHCWDDAGPPKEDTNLLELDGDARNTRAPARACARLRAGPGQAGLHSGGRHGSTRNSRAKTTMSGSEGSSPTSTGRSCILIPSRRETATSSWIGSVWFFEVLPRVRPRQSGSRCGPCAAAGRR